MNVHRTAGRPVPTQARLLRLARHYQDLAERHHDEERFWLCRATYFGRRSYNP